MLNRKPIPYVLTPVCAALAWASTAAAENQAAVAEDSTLPIIAVVGTVLLLIAILAWRALSARREKKPDPAAFMTLEQITRLDSPEGASTLMRTVQPKPMPSRRQATTENSRQPPSPSDAYMSELEKRYPRIVEKLVTMWPNQESENYLQSLTIDERGDREGFSPEVAAEIMLLYGVKAKSHDGHGGFWH